MGIAPEISSSANETQYRLSFEYRRTQIGSRSICIQNCLASGVLNGSNDPITTLPEAIVTLIDGEPT